MNIFKNSSDSNTDYYCKQCLVSDYHAFQLKIWAFSMSAFKFHCVGHRALPTFQNILLLADRIGK